MMNYAQEANSVSDRYMGESAAIRTPDLGRLKAIAERVAQSAARVEAFLERYNGPVPAASDSAAVNPPSTSYRNDIEDLFFAITRLEGAVNSLSDIG
jgi:hypothetical protein